MRTWHEPTAVMIGRLWACHHKFPQTCVICMSDSDVAWKTLLLTSLRHRDALFRPVVLMTEACLCLAALLLRSSGAVSKVGAQTTKLENTIEQLECERDEFQQVCTWAIASIPLTQSSAREPRT